VQSVSVAYAKDKLPSLLHLVEQGENIEITRHGKTVAVITGAVSGTTTENSASPFETAYRRFRALVEADGSYTEEDWNDCFNIPRAVEMNLRHEEDFV
jgi:prevent-host-death family protein